MQISLEPPNPGNATLVQNGWHPLLGWGWMGGTPRSGRVLAAGKIPGCQAESSQIDLVVLWRAWRCEQVLVAPGLLGFPMLRWQ